MDYPILRSLFRIALDTAIAHRRMADSPSGVIAYDRMVDLARKGRDACDCADRDGVCRIAQDLARLSCAFDPLRRAAEAMNLAQFVAAQAGKAMQEDYETIANHMRHAGARRSETAPHTAAEA